MTQMVWIDLHKLLPKGRNAVLLFHPTHQSRDFPGHPVSVSNVSFARLNALACGYTHWAPIPYPLPRKKKTR